MWKLWWAGVSVGGEYCAGVDMCISTLYSIHQFVTFSQIHHRVMEQMRPPSHRAVG